MKYLSILLLWLLIAIEACAQTRILPPVIIKSKGRKIVIQTADTTKITLNDSIELFQIGNDFYIKNKNYQGKCKISFSNEGITISKIYHDTIMINPTRGIIFDNPYGIQFFSTSPGDIESKIDITNDYAAFKTMTGTQGLYFDDNLNIHLIIIDDSLTWTGQYLKIAGDTAATRAYARSYGGEGAGSPGGTSGQIQWNDYGVFNGFGTWDGVRMKIGTDTVGMRSFIRSYTVKNYGGGGEGDLVIGVNNHGIRMEGNLRFNDVLDIFTSDGTIEALKFRGKAAANSPLWLESSANYETIGGAFKFITANSIPDGDTIFIFKNYNHVLLVMYDDSIANKGDLHVYGDLIVDGSSPGGGGSADRYISFVGTFDYIAEISDTAGKITIPAGMNGMNLVDMQVSSDNNADRVVTVNVHRLRAGVLATMTSVGATLGTEYTVSDETIDTDYDDIVTGDRIFITWLQSAGTNKHLGLYVTLTFQSP